MANLLSILVASLIIHFSAAAYCRFAHPDNEEVKKILKAERAALTGLTPLTMAAAVEEQESVTPDISRMCKTQYGMAQIREEAHDDRLLGVGKFGFVVPVKWKGEENAVKILSFAHNFHKTLTEALARTKNRANIIQKVIDHFQNLAFISPPSNPDDNALLDLTSFDESTNALVKAIEEEEFGLGLDELASAELRKFLDALIREVDINEALQKGQAGHPSSIVEYRRCYIDANLNAYIVMQRLGPSLFILRASCLSPIVARGFADSIPRNLLMLYTAARLHDNFINICDIKPENIMAGLDYDPKRLYFTDFGLSAVKKACHGGTPAYVPPEMLVPGYSKTPFEKLTKRNTRVVSLVDSYALGLMMSAMELSLMPFSTIDNAHDQNVARIRKFKGVYENFKAEAQTLQENVMKALAKEASKQTYPSKEAGACLGKAQQLVNKVIYRLIDPDYETRLSIQEAFYLYFVLSKILTEEHLALTNTEVLESGYASLVKAERLFDSLEELNAAMEGRYADPSKPDDLAKDPDILSLASDITLPAYVDVLAELKATLADKNRRLLI